MVKCGMCQRQFKTQAALRQHRLASHEAGPSPRVRPPPVRAAARRPAPAPAMSKQLTSGTDCCGTFTVSPNSAVGTIVYQQPISLADMGISRLATEATLWSRWRPKRLLLRVVCSGASTTFGGLVVGWTPEETWQATLSTSDGARIASFRPSVVMRLNETRTLSIPCETLTKWYLTDGERGLSIHGTVVGAVSAIPGGFTGQLSVAFYLDWTIEFEGVNVQIRPFTAEVIKPDSGWSNLFTTSDSSFNSERLTLKMHSGGSMCPFSAARLDRVYVPAANPATTVPYYDESGTSKSVVAFARVQGYSVPGLLCFSSAKDATEYVRTGDVTKALKYTKAGAYATPAVPAFVAQRPVSKEAAIGVLLDHSPELYDMKEFDAVLKCLDMYREDESKQGEDLQEAATSDPATSGPSGVATAASGGNNGKGFQ